MDGSLEDTPVKKKRPPEKPETSRKSFTLTPRKRKNKKARKPPTSQPPPEEKQNKTRQPSTSQPPPPRTPVPRLLRRPRRLLRRPRRLRFRLPPLRLLQLRLGEDRLQALQLFQALLRASEPSCQSHSAPPRPGDGSEKATPKTTRVKGIGLKRPMNNKKACKTCCLSLFV